MNLIKIINKSIDNFDLYIGVSMSGDHDSPNVNFRLCDDDNYSIDGYHLFYIDMDGVELSYSIGEDCDEDDEDDVIVRPSIDTDSMNHHCLKVTGVDWLYD